MPLSSISSSEAGSKPRILSGSWGGWWANVATLDALSFAKVRNKLEIKKEKGEKVVSYPENTEKYHRTIVPSAVL